MSYGDWADHEEVVAEKDARIRTLEADLAEAVALLRAIWRAAPEIHTDRWAAFLARMEPKP